MTKLLLQEHSVFYGRTAEIVSCLEPVFSYTPTGTVPQFTHTLPTDILEACCTLRAPALATTQVASRGGNISHFSPPPQTPRRY